MEMCNLATIFLRTSPQGRQPFKKYVKSLFCMNEGRNKRTKKLKEGGRHVPVVNASASQSGGLQFESRFGCLFSTNKHEKIAKNLRKILRRILRESEARK